MRITLVALLLVVGAAGAAPPGVGPVVWRDEFDGTALDETKWGYYPWATRDDATVTRDAVSVSGGVLNMRIYTEGGVHHTGYIQTVKRQTSGAYTDFLFAPTFGYFEARIRFHSVQGAWSAFWMQSPTNGNPVGDAAKAGVEIDIVEHRGTNSGNQSILRRFNAGVHWDGYGEDHKQNTQFLPRQEGLGNDSWHTYGLLWTPTSYTIYFDDTPLWTLPAEVPVSQRSEYLILSSEIRDGSWAGTIPAGGYGSRAVSTNGMSVDYVRAYALPEPAGVTGAVMVLAGFLVVRRRPSGADLAAVVQ